MNNMLDVHFLELSPVESPGLDTLPRIDQRADQDHDSSVLALLFDEVSHGVLVVSPKGRVIHCNRAARDHMASSSVLYTRQGELMALSPIDGKLLDTAIDKASMGIRSLVKLSGSGITLMLSAVPLRAREGQTCQHIALFFERAAICDSGMFVFFARTHGLTRTEEQVLTLLCRGLSTPDIAAVLNVAVSTVRSHARALCCKTGSKGCRELINRIATLPPVGISPKLSLD